jgi:hypothetical protein
MPSALSIIDRYKSEIQILPNPNITKKLHFGFWILDLPGILRFEFWISNLQY